MACNCSGKNMGQETYGYNVIFEKLHPMAQLPVYAHSGDAGADLFAVEDVTLKPFEVSLLRTGLRMKIPASINPFFAFCE